MKKSGKIKRIIVIILVILTSFIWSYFTIGLTLFAAISYMQNISIFYSIVVYIFWVAYFIFMCYLILKIKTKVKPAVFRILVNAHCILIPFIFSVLGLFVIPWDWYDFGDAKWAGLASLGLGMGYMIVYFLTIGFCILYNLIWIIKTIIVRIKHKNAEEVIDK